MPFSPLILVAFLVLATMTSELCPTCGAYWSCDCREKQALADRREFIEAIEEMAAVDELMHAGIDMKAWQQEIKDRDKSEEYT